MRVEAPAVFVTKPGSPRIAFAAPAVLTNARTFAYVAAAASWPVVTPGVFLMPRRLRAARAVDGGIVHPIGRDHCGEVCHDELFRRLARLPQKLFADIRDRNDRFRSQGQLAERLVGRRGRGAFARLPGETQLARLTRERDVAREAGEPSSAHQRPSRRRVSPQPRHP